MYSDPDFTAKLYMGGVRFMKGLQASRIYHFETKSTTRIRKNCGQMQFLLKWGMTSSTFRKVFTYKGEDFNSQKIGTFKTGNRFNISLIRSRLKGVFYLLTKDFGPLMEILENVRIFSKCPCWKTQKKSAIDVMLSRTGYLRYFNVLIDIISAR